MNTAAGAVKGWNWDISQLANGILDVERMVMPFDSGSIGSVTVDRAALHQVSVAAGFGLVLIPALDSDAVFVDGRRLVAGDAVLLPPCGELELLSHGVGRIYLIAFRNPGAGSRVRLRRPRWYSRADGCSSSLTEDVAAWIAAVGAAADAHRAAALQARLLAWLRSANVETPHAEFGGHALPRRRMAVERVRRFIQEHLAESMTLADLCHHAHLQARSLEYGFRDLVGLSPFKYIKMLRLAEVRRRLQASNAGERSVSQVALDCGFSHLSQFAADYKRAFLESPSATARSVDSRQASRVARYDTLPAAAVAR
jgi:AraC-like DNA-binding protein